MPANDDDDTDMSFAGTLENIDTLADSPTPTTMTSSPGRTTGRPWSVVLTEPQLLADSSIEVAGASGLSYLASSGLSGLDTALSSGAVDEVFAGEDGVATEPVLAASIATGGISLNVLLGGPDLPGKADGAVSSRSPCWFHCPRRRWRWPPRCGPYRQTLRRRRFGLKRRRRRPTITTRRRKPRRPGSCS